MDESDTVSLRLFMKRVSGSDAGLPWLAAMVGAVLAAWVIFQNRGEINSDGILYIEVARLLSLGQWQAGLSLYNWPLYPLLIMLVHKLSGLGFQSAAHVLAGVAFAVTSGGLLVLIREVGGNRPTLLAGMILLFSSPYMVGNILPMVVRDQSFWAAHVWSLVFFIRFYRERTLRQALWWGVTGSLAVLFRVEAITYLLLLPLVVLHDEHYPPRERVRQLIKAHMLVLSALAAIVVAFVVYPSLHPEHLGRLQDPVAVAGRVYQQLVNGLSEKANTYGEQVLGGFLKDYALGGLLLTLGYAFLFKVLSVAGWLQTWVAMWERVTPVDTFKKQFNPVFYWLLLLGIGNALCIILANFLLPKRYLMPIAFIVLVYAAFGLHTLYEQWAKSTYSVGLRRFVFPGVVVVLLIQLLAIIWPNDPEKLPALQATNWLKLHAHGSDRIYYDSRRMQYYVTGDSSDRTEDDWQKVYEIFRTGEVKQFDYAVVRISRKQQEHQVLLTNLAGGAPVAAFDNGRGDLMLIFRFGR